MSVLDRKLLRELRASWLLLTAIISIIAVGVACYVSMGAAYHNLTEAKRRYYRQCRMADFWVDLKKVPLAELDALAELPGVAAIRPRIGFYATVDLEHVTKPLNGMVLSLPARREAVINDVVLRRGGYFTDRRENEVIVNEAFAARHGLKPGDWIRLVLNNRRQELFIVGTAISSEFVYLLQPGSLAPDAEHFGVFYLKQTYAEDVFDFDGAANQIVGRLDPQVRPDPTELLAGAERLLSPYGVFSTTPLGDQVSNKFLSQEIEGLKVFAVIMPCIFLAVAAMVLNVLLRRLAEQQRTVVGTLKALGYSDRQVFVHFLKFGLAVGLAGGLVGCGAGHWLAEGLTYMYRQVYEFPELVNRFYPELLLIAVGISLGCAVLGSLQGTRAVLRLKPAEAMRPKPPKKGGAVLLERVGWFWSRLSSGWRMVVRGVIRSRMRTIAGVFAAAMGSAILVNGFMMMDAARYLVDYQFKWILRSDVDLALKDERTEDALREAARLPGVDWAEPILNVSCTFQNGPFRRKGAITGIAPDARLTVPRDLEAAPIPVPSTGLVMSRKLAEVLHLKRGDLVTVRPTKGLRRERQVPVLQISDSFFGMAVYADIHYLSRLVHEELALSGVQLTTDRNPAHIDALYRELKRMPALQGVSARRDMIANLEKILVEQMGILITAFVLFAGVVFFGSILNASLISLSERQREVATLRVLGYGPWQVGSLLLRESMIVTLVGTFLGMPIGYGLSVLTAMAYDTELFRFPVIATPGTWIWTLALAVLFGLSAHAVVQIVVHRMDWLEALQAKE
ncbi:MAG TPA: ABC transporter permease [Thermoguttaceae bacterium]|nr:ABC transporter permease [Thermoguttaceae bacterium]